MRFCVRTLFLVSLLLVCGWARAQAPTPISGVINNYYAVTQVFNLDSMSVDSVRVVDNSGIAAGEYFIIMQMQGNDVDLNLGLDYSYVGRYDIIRVARKVGSDIVVFSSTVSHYNTGLGEEISYSLPGRVQLISLPRYKNADVSGVLSCAPWNGTTGGVLAVMVDDALTLNANIDVSGKGYRGASSTTVNSCIHTESFYLEDLDPLADSVGIKGEGIVFPYLDSLYYRGISNITTDGFGQCAGGGAGKNAGGGGGGNKGSGGVGAISDCFTRTIFASGAKTHKYQNDLWQLRIYMGGGGGGATSATGAGSVAGNGGGIALIIGRTLKGNGFSILSNGTAASSNSTGGAGGGGAGGTILLNVSSYEGKLTAGAKGGNGGDGMRAGGGGGGGYVWYKPSVSGSIFKIEATGGSRGASAVSPNSSDASAGNSGGSDSTFQLQGRGLLNNYYDPVFDTVCSGDTPLKIEPSEPTGGYGKNSFSYQWVKKGLSDADFITAPGTSDGMEYQPGALTEGTSYKRYVFSISSTTGEILADSSKDLEYRVHVYPALSNYQIAGTDTLCSGVLAKLIGEPGIGGGTGSINYIWQCDSSSSYKTTGSTPSLAVLKAETAKKVYHYRRISYSPIAGVYNPNVCSKISAPASLTILPPISSNELASYADTMVCQDLKAALSASLPAGGDGPASFKYQWLAGASLDSIPGAITKDLLSPPLVNELIVRRRVWVLSGSSIVCSSVSSPKRIIVPVRISNNEISHIPVVCEAVPAGIITGTNPSGAVQGNFTYYWQKSADGLSWSQEYSTNIQSETNWNPGTLFTTPSSSYRFRRLAWSGDNNTCKDTSTAILVTVEPELKNNNISLSGQDTLCYQDTPGLLTGTNKPVLLGGDGANYTFVWQSLEGSISNVGTSKDYQFPDPVSESLRFRRLVSSGTCRDTSNEIFIKVYPAIVGNALVSPDTICLNTSPSALQVGSVTGGMEGAYEYKWTRMKGSINAPEITGEIYPVDTLFSSDYDSLPVHFTRTVFSPSISNPVCKSELASTTLYFWKRPRAVLTMAPGMSLSVCEDDPVSFMFKADSGTAPFVFNYSMNELLRQGISTGNQETVSVFPATDLKSERFTIAAKQLTDAKGCVAYPAGFSISGRDSVSVRNRPYVSGLKPTTLFCSKDSSLQAILDGPRDSVSWNYFPSPAAWSVIENPYQLQTRFYSLNADTTARDTITLYLVSDNLGCRDSAFTSLNLNRKPEALLMDNADSSRTLYYRYSHEIGVQPIDWNVEAGSWTVDPAGPTVSLKQKTAGILEYVAETSRLGTTPYTFRWTVSNQACENENSTEARLIFSDILVYDGISPNGDGLNDYLYCEGMDSVDTYELLVVDKLGTQVYLYRKASLSEVPAFRDGSSLDQVDAIWDGKKEDGMVLPDGTYYYWLKVNGTYYKKQGESAAGHYLILRTRENK